MTNQKLQTLKGFRDFLPQQMAVRNKVIGIIKNVFELYGFEELQTPTLETQEILLGKYGEEAEKLMYLFEDQGKRKIGMRYDLTVPLARSMAQNTNLPLPFKRYQIQPVWRAENTQRGRYREFYQCDADIIGSSSPLADGEIIAVIYNILDKLNFKSFKIKVNSRSVLFKTMENAGIEESKWLSVIQSIDKLDKKSREEVEQELVNKNIKLEEIKSVFDQLEKVQPDNFLTETINYAYSLGVQKDNLIFDPTLSRGLDYYTGPIFESVVEEPKIGSLTGGGRYDNLIKSLGGPDLAATGTTIGLERLIDVITELNLLNISNSAVQVLVTIFDKNLLNESLKTALYLREQNINTELYPDENAKLEKQLKYADKKQIPYVIIIGEEEVKTNTVVLKNMKAKEQETIKLEDIAANLQ